MIEFLDLINTSGGEVMSIIVIGIDLAKSILSKDVAVNRLRLHRVKEGFHESIVSDLARWPTSWRASALRC
ncbi:MAG: hypothetical protein K0M39_15990 [Rhizobium sp.]|nr:hypothetical protein [Rhizobium sp.]